MKQFPLIVTLLVAGLSFTGCPADLEVPPAFVSFAGFDLRTPGVGPATSDISEVWVFAETEFVGAFPLPARIPVLRAGATQMRFLPGVRQNGVSSAPEIYEFYQEVARTLELVPGETVALGPQVIGYKPEVRFAINEGFEPGSERAFSLRINGDTTLQVSQERVRSGEFSGKISLTEAVPLLEMSSTETFQDLIATSPSVWLEVDFLSDAFINWGITGRQGVNTVRNFDPISRPREEWTKIYFNLTEIIVRSNLESYNLNFSALLPEGVSAGDVYLDNIKLLHF